MTIFSLLISWVSLGLIGVFVSVIYRLRLSKMIIIADLPPLLIILVLGPLGTGLVIWMWTYEWYKENKFNKLVSIGKKS